MAAPSEPTKANADGVADHFKTLAQTVINRQITQRMSEASGAITSFSGTVRDIGTEVQKKQPSEAVGNITGTIAERTDAIASYLENTPPDQMLADLRTFSGEKPAIAAILALVVGYTAARVVKTATSQSTS